MKQMSENCIHDKNYICTVTETDLLCENIENCKFKIKKMKSKIGELNWKDGLKALLLAVITSVITVILATLEAGSLHFDWKNIGIVALTTALAYILKNWLTNSQDKILKKEIK